ncbi:MAG: rhodanese-like domain-containing protein [Chitinophagales bacterium]|nr:rhodanese-like domain-containing protein [Chitinophagales bacterium]
MKLRSIFLSVFLLNLSISCIAQVNDAAFNSMLKNLLSHSVKEISVKDAANKKGVLFLDAREIEEYKVSHLKNAANVGYNKFDIACMKSVSKEQPIIVYCSVGYRSEKISEKLFDAGFKNVQNLYGGIFEWVNEGNVVYDSAGKPTSSVHAYDHSWGTWLKKGDKVY